MSLLKSFQFVVNASVHGYPRQKMGPHEQKVYGYPGEKRYSLATRLIAEVEHQSKRKTTKLPPWHEDSGSFEEWERTTHPERFPSDDYDYDLDPEGVCD